MPGPATPLPDRDADWLAVYGLSEAETDAVLRSLEGVAPDKDNPLRVRVFKGDLGAVLRDAGNTGSLCVIEVPEAGGAHSNPARWRELVERGRHCRGFFADISTLAAYKNPTAELFGRVIGAYFGLVEDQASSVHTILSETLSNAMIHGNMNLASPDYKSIDDFAQFQAEIEAKLETPEIANRRISVHAFIDGEGGEPRLCVRIGDEGAGFNPDRLDMSMENHDKASNRGVALMHIMVHSLVYEDKGRTAVIHFPFAGRIPQAGRETEGAPGAGAARVETNIPEWLGDDDGGNLADAGELVGSLAKCRILITDDEELMRTVMRLHLEEEGYENLVFAENGLEAWNKLLAVGEKPDLAILDVEMPEMNGFELTKRIRDHPRLKDIPIIISSARKESGFQNKAMAAGASDVLLKPLDPALLSDRVHKQLENRMLIIELTRYRKNLQAELGAARRMLEDLLPDKEAREAIREKYGVNLQALYQPSSELGGDWWGVSPLSETRFAIFVVDFSGHGVGPCFNVFRLHTVITTGNVVSPDKAPDEVLSELNKYLASLLPRGQYATMFYGVVDIADNSLTYSAAGSPNPLKAGAGVLSTRGIPLGLSKTATYDRHKSSFGEGEYLFLYSDALIETPNHEGEYLSEAEICGELTRLYGAGVDEGTLAGLREWFDSSVSAPPDDDLTLLMIAR